MRGLGILAGLAALGAGASTAFGYDNIHAQRQKRDHRKGASGSIATGNRWGGPHRHEREIARRRRQEGRG